MECGVYVLVKETLASKVANNCSYRSMFRREIVNTSQQCLFTSSSQTNSHISVLWSVMLHYPAYTRYSNCFINRGLGIVPSKNCSLQQCQWRIQIYKVKLEETKKNFVGCKWTKNVFQDRSSTENTCENFV